MLDSSDLDLLRTVAQGGGVSAAAAIVHLSQPAVSRRIQSMERRLGVKLFQKSGRRLQLTEAGEECVRRASDILDRIHDLEAEMGAFGRGQRGVLRIGATATVCLYLLPPILQRMRLLFPQYELFLSNETSRQMPELVRQGLVDVGIAAVTGALAGLETTPWMELHLGLLHREPLLENPPSIRILHEAPLVRSSPGSLSSLLDRTLQDHDVHPRVVAQADSLEVVRVLVSCGFGYAVAPLEVMRQDAVRTGLFLSAFQEDLDPLPVACFYRRTLPPLRSFLQLLHETSDV